MAQLGRYRVSLLDWDTDKVIDLYPGDDFLSITWQHRQNEPCPYMLDLVAETGTKDRFLKHYQILIERNWDDNPANWYEEYVGFHLGYHERWVYDTVDEHYWASLGLSPEWLVEQPLLQPLMNTGNANWAFYDTWWASDYADNVLKLMVGESMISPADADRRFSNLALQGNTGEAVWGCYEGKWVRLLMAMVNTIGQDGSKGGCDFGVVKVAGGYEFRTFTPFRGTDRRRGNPYGHKPTIFSAENANIINTEKQVLWAEAVTVAYGGWEGGDQERTIYPEENAAGLAETPYARREEFYDLRDVSTPDSIPSILQQKLIDDGEKTFVNAQIQQTDGCLYGRDFVHGDLVTLDLPDSTSYDMRVVEVNGRIDGDNEETIEGVIELWTRD